MPKNPVTDPVTDQEIGGTRTFSLGREQILMRLWELALLSPEATRGSITGQMKAMSLIVAIEGLIPDRRRSAVPAKPASPLANASFSGNANRQGYREPEKQQSREAETPVQPPAASAAPGPQPSSPLNPFVNPIPTSRTSAARNLVYDAHIPDFGSLQLSFASGNDKSQRGR